LHYYYTPGTNRLEYIDDSATTVYGINIDIKDQSPGNSQYDAIGNLVSSVNRPISGIKWNVYGKIVDIQKTAVGNATANYIYYNYDPSGNRIGQVTRHNSGINTIYRYTWYVRDAQGNVIAVYKVADTKTVSSGTLQLAEHHMYGSSRLGIINRDIDADQPKHNADNSNNHLGEAFLINFTRGNKFFELTNHLGNVLSTITDNKLPTPVQNNPLLIASYSADLVTAIDYSPFGMTLPGRVYNNHWRRYRYGFNGKENDNEVQGEYNELDYGMRVYDPRVGRFLSVDPLTKTFPWYTPYQFAGNKPIWATDLDGLEENTTSTYVYRPPVLSLKPTFRGTISITDATAQKAHKTFEGSYSQLGNADRSHYSQNIVQSLVGSNVGTEGSRLDITMTGTRSEVSKTWKGSDIKYFTQFAYSFTNNNVTEIGNFEMQSGQIQASARAWDPLTFLLVNKVVSSVVITAAKSPAATQEMVTLYRSISAAEAESIQSTKQLSLGTGMEAKQFWQTKEGLDAWNKTALAGEYNLEITVPKSMVGNGKPINTTVQVDEFIGPNATIDRTAIKAVNEQIQTYKITPIKQSQ
ncbi:MAG: RHS repeat-associated core domain-containing protein, partial [Agriterribacter sp.]